MLTKKQHNSLNKGTTTLAFGSLIAFILLIAIFGFSQTKVQAKALEMEDYAAALSQMMEDYARKVLERHVPSEEFLLEVNVIPQEKEVKNLPYMPDSLGPRPVKSSTPTDLQPFIKSMKIEVFFTKRYSGKKVQTQVQSLLFKKLKMKKERGDSIKFSILGIDVNKPQTEIERSLTRTEADLRDARQRADSYKKERDDLKLELTTTKSKIDDLKTNLSKSESAEKGSLADKVTDTYKENPWIKNAIIIAGILTLFIALYMLSRIFAGAINSVGDGMRSVAKAIEQSSTSKNAIESGQDIAVLPPQEEVKALPPPPMSNLPTIPLESLHSRLIKLYDEILENLSVGKSESIIIQHLNNLLTKPETVSRAVAGLELLGRQKASEVFLKLSFEGQELVINFLKNGTYDRPKPELMLEAGEEIKTKLLANYLTDSSRNVSNEVAEKIMQFKDDDLADLVTALNSDVLPRLFIYLEPTKIANIMAHLHKRDEKIYQVAAAALPKLPNSQKSQHLDEKLIVGINQKLKKLTEDAQRPFLKLYQSVIESSDDEIAEDLTNKIAQESAKVAEYLNNQIIFFDTLFRLPKEVVSDVVFERMSNKDIAALLTGVTEDKKEFIHNHIDSRRKDLITEEYERLSAKGPRQVKIAHKGSKKIVMKILKDLKMSGEIDIALIQQGQQGQQDQQGQQEGDTSQSQPESVERIDESNSNNSNNQVAA